MIPLSRVDFHIEEWKNNIERIQRGQKKESGFSTNQSVKMMDPLKILYNLLS